MANQPTELSLVADLALALSLVAKRLSHEACVLPSAFATMGQGDPFERIFQSRTSSSDDQILAPFGEGCPELVAWSNPQKANYAFNEFPSVHFCISSVPMRSTRRFLTVATYRGRRNEEVGNGWEMCGMRQ